MPLSTEQDTPYLIGLSCLQVALLSATVWITFNDKPENRHTTPPLSHQEWSFLSRYNVLVRPATANLMTKLLLILEDFDHFDENSQNNPFNILSASVILSVGVALMCQMTDSIVYSKTTEKKAAWSLAGLGTLSTSGYLLSEKTESFDSMILAPIAASIASILIGRTLFANSVPDFQTIKKIPGNTASERRWLPGRLPIKFFLGIFGMAFTSRMLSWGFTETTFLSRGTFSGIAYALCVGIAHYLCSKPNDAILFNPTTESWNSHQRDVRESLLCAIGVFGEAYFYDYFGFNANDDLSLAMRTQLNVIATTSVYCLAVLTCLHYTPYFNVLIQSTQADLSLPPESTLTVPLNQTIDEQETGQNDDKISNNSTCFEKIYALFSSARSDKENQEKTKHDSFTGSKCSV